MSTARDQIFGAIRTALKRGPLDPETARDLAANLRNPRRNLIPARATALDQAGRVDLFQQMAEAVSASVARIADIGAAPGEIARYLANHNLPTDLVIAPALSDLAWSHAPLLAVRAGRAENADLVSVAPAFAAIAETGTLMLISGADTPTTLNLLPDTHIVILHQSAIVASYEEGWTRLRDGTADTAMPRTVNFITGPSRTGDIEQKIQLGAHGPRRLHIILIAGE